MIIEEDEEEEQEEQEERIRCCKRIKISITSIFSFCHKCFLLKPNIF